MYTRIARPTVDRSLHAWWLYMVASYFWIWCFALVFKAVIFTLRHGFWPGGQWTRSHPSSRVEDALGWFLNEPWTAGICFCASIVICIAALFLRRRPWSTAAWLALSGFAMFVLVLVLDPGRLFTWYLD